MIWKQLPKRLREKGLASVINVLHYGDMKLLKEHKESGYQYETGEPVKLTESENSDLDGFVWGRDDSYQNLVLLAQAA